MFNPLALVVATIIPILIGYIWYGPFVFEKAWRKAARVTEAETQSGNLFLILVLVLFCSFFITMSLHSMVNHQMGLYSLAAFYPETSPDHINLMAQMEQYKDLYRTFGHGAFHGGAVTVFFVMPIIAIMSLFERRGWRYIAIHSGYWLVTLAIMGGIVCGWTA